MDNGEIKREMLHREKRKRASQTLFLHKCVKSSLLRGIALPDGTDRSGIDDVFLHATQLKKGVADRIGEGTDGAGAQGKSCAGQIEVLSNVSGIDQGDAVGVLIPALPELDIILSDSSY